MKMLELDSETYKRRLAKEINKADVVYFGSNRIVRARIERFDPVQDAWRRHPGVFLVVRTMSGARLAISSPYALHDGSGNEIVASREVR